MTRLLLCAVLVLLSQPTAARQLADDALPWLKNGTATTVEPSTKSAPKPTIALQHQPVDMRLIFKDEDVELSTQHMTRLINELDTLSNKASVRLLLHSYASKRGGRESTARRTALARAVALRRQLEKFGYTKRNISMRIIVAGTADRPRDRIDIEELR